MTDTQPTYYYLSAYQVVDGREAPIPGWQVYVGGQPVQIVKRSLRISEAVEERSTCDFVVWDPFGDLHFTKGQPVEVINSGVVAFRGFINDVTEKKLAPGDYRLLHTVHCTDMHYLADKRIVASTYVDQYAGDIVQDIINRWLAAEGVQAGLIEPGPVIHNVVLNYVTAAQALDALAQAADFTWWIDYDRTLYFGPRTMMPAPRAADNSIARSVTVKIAADRYRNRQYIRGAKALTDPQTETRHGDGNTRSFALGYPLGEEPVILVNGQPQTVGIKGVDTGKQWYWSKGDAVIVQDDNAPPLSPSDTLTVQYRGLYNVIIVTEDNAAIADRQTVEGGGTGLVEDIQDAPDAADPVAAFELGNALLKKYTVIGRTLEFTTNQPFHAGQLLIANFPEHGLDGAELLIQSVDVSDADPILWYRITAVEGPVMGSWAKALAAGLQRPIYWVDKVTVGEEQAVVILASSSETWPWAEDVTETVYLCPVPSDSLYPSDNIYPC